MVNINDFLEEKECSTLNLAVDTEYTYLMQCLGGMEKVQTKYPVVYDRLDMIRQKNQKGELLDDKTVLEIPEPAKELVDAVYLPAVYYRDKTLTVYYVASYCEIPKAMYLTIKVLNADGMLVQQEKLDPEKPTFFLSGKCTFEKLDLDKGYSVLLESYVTLKRKDLSVTVARSKVSTEEIFAQRADVNAPKKQNDTPQEVPDEKVIRAFYNRFPSRPSEVDVDYVYENAYDPDKKIVHVNLEASGNIALTRDVEPGSFQEGDDIAIMDFGCGAVKYTSEGATMSIRDKKFTWLFKPDWNASIPCNYYFSETVVHLSYKLGFLPLGELDERILYLSSILEEDMGYSCRKIRRLRVQIGCVAENTLVRMSDGSAKKIRDIQSGDMILASPEGEIGTVVSTWHGKERKMYCIETVDGHELLLTGSHYVLTDRGMVMAAKIHLGLKIRMEDGSLQTIKSLYTLEEETNVYNLSVRREDGSLGCMICEGMVLADNDYQEKPRQPQDHDSLEADEFLLELAALMKER